MRIIIITSPVAVEGETASICRLLDSGVVDRLHLRKPSLTEVDTRLLIERIPERLYPAISIHDHHHLAAEYGLGGIHLNSRNPLPPVDGFPGFVSRSCHSVEEVKKALLIDNADYCFLSPLFDSVSKRGYKGAIGEAECHTLSLDGLLTERVIPLSGITPERLPEVARLGFKGAAILGAAWETDSIDDFINRLRKLK
ncbi:MAG: thiamine phosphate synthase [Muribaculaceae bacterium]|nr:thiamine phosphate synthase [Muribaculaceae bacterium]